MTIATRLVRNHTVGDILAYLYLLHANTWIVGIKFQGLINVPVSNIRMDRS